MWCRRFLYIYCYAVGSNTAQQCCRTFSSPRRGTPALGTFCGTRLENVFSLLLACFRRMNLPVRMPFKCKSMVRALRYRPFCEVLYAHHSIVVCPLAGGFVSRGLAGSFSRRPRHDATQVVQSNSMQAIIFDGGVRSRPVCPSGGEEGRTCARRAAIPRRRRPSPQSRFRDAAQSKFYRR